VIEDPDKPVPDAVDSTRFCRVVLRPTEDGWEATELLEPASGEPLGLYESLAEARRKLPSALGPGVKFLHLSGAETESELDSDESPAPGSARVAYFAVRTVAADLEDAEDFASLQRRDLPLKDHLDQAAEVARRLCAKLGLANDLADAVVQACARHDTGKLQPQWQKAIGNSAEVPLAKSAKPGFNHDATRGFRHELLSLLEAADDPALAEHPRLDLILHLIAAHHGHSRPGFSPKAYGILHPHARCSKAAEKAALRFARLQRELGWWQLAYLEALVKCADAIASREADAATP
jgi:CRISPR-associated helicase Cas3